jgi:hypothetical protein
MKTAEQVVQKTRYGHCHTFTNTNSMVVCMVKGLRSEVFA